MTIVDGMLVFDASDLTSLTTRTQNALADYGTASGLAPEQYLSNKLNDKIAELTEKWRANILQKSAKQLQIAVSNDDMTDEAKATVISLLNEL